MHLMRFEKQQKKSFILKTEYVLPVIALAFFGLSAGLDVLDPAGINPYLFKDGATLAGTVIWLASFFHTGASPLFHKAGRPSALDGPPALESSEFEPVSLKDYQSPRKARGTGYGGSSRRE
jgi:hypothetical protein